MLAARPPASAQTPGADATLSGLTLSEGRLSPAFASGTTAYTASVGYTVTRIAVVPSTTDANATVAYLDSSDMPLTDANTVTGEQDVDLAVGETVVKVQVTAEDTSTVQTYTVTITRTVEDSPDITVVELVSGLSIPWDIAFTPDGTMLFTQLSGVLSSRLVDGAVQTVSADFSDFSARGTRGLMGIVVDPDFASNRRFYTCQGHTGPEVQVIAWTISADYTAATRVGDPLVGDLPAVAYHSGCRLRFGPDGYLWIATGDAFAVGAAQDLDSLGGKVLRVDASTGAAAPGNPFGSPVYTYGHRNPQGLALRPDTRQMWLVDHGPTWDDEINLLTAGGNYGWDPVLADMPNVYTERVPMTDLMKFPDAVEARWSSGEPTLATSGGIFLAGDDWEQWDGRLAVGTLKASELYVFEFTAAGTFVSQVVVPELDGTYGRLRTPMLGPEGALYVTTSNGGGADRILKVAPSLPPSFASETDEQEVAENSSAATVVATVTATDPERQALTYALSGPDAASFTIPNSAAGQLRANAPLDREDATSYEVIVTASDPYGLSDSITLTINVTDIDEPAEITLTASPGVSADNNELSVDENHDGTLATFSASDPERKAGLTYEWSVVGTDLGDFAITAAGVLSFAAIPDYERPADSGGNNVYDLTVSALDSDGERGNIAVTVTVEPVNEAPTITGDAAPSLEEEGSLLVGTYRAADPENATIAWLPLAGADEDKFEFNTSNGRLNFKAEPDFEDTTDSVRNNVYDVTLSVSAGGHTTTFDVEVTVTNKEEPGVLALPPTRPQAEADYTATLSDPDGVASTTWTWERSMSRSDPWAPVTGAVNSTTTTSVYTPVTDDVGYYLRATAAYTDALGDKSPDAVSTNSVLAAPVSNTPPVFTETNPTRSVAENARANAPVGGPVTATDPDPLNTVRYEFEPLESDLFTIHASTGQIRVKTDGALDYDDPANRSHTLKVKALDGSNASATVEVTIEVTNVNEPPDAVADVPDRFYEDTAITIDVLGNDNDPEDDRSQLLLTVFNSRPNAPLNGTVSVNEPANPGENRTITYEPNANYHGSDTFSYQVRDTGSPSLSSTATVSVQIDAVNDAPTFVESMPTRLVSESAEHPDKVGSPVAADGHRRGRHAHLQPLRRRRVFVRDRQLRPDHGGRGSHLRYRHAGDLLRSRSKPTTTSSIQRPSRSPSPWASSAIPPPISGGGRAAAAAAAAEPSEEAAPRRAIWTSSGPSSATSPNSAAVTTRPRACGPTARRSGSSRTATARTTPSTPTTSRPVSASRTASSRSMRSTARRVASGPTAQPPGSPTAAATASSPTTSRPASASRSATSHSPDATATRAASGPATRRCGCWTVGRTVSSPTTSGAASCSRSTSSPPPTATRAASSSTASPSGSPTTARSVSSPTSSRQGKTARTRSRGTATRSSRARC